MRIVLACFLHETNTFSPLPTVYSDFEVLPGWDMLSRIHCRDVFKQAGAQIVPILYASALPSGTVDPTAFARLRDRIVDTIDQAVDGIWLHLHGAMEVDGIGSGEAALLRDIRQKVGQDVPIAVVLDFHANNTQWISEYANIVCGYRTAPHVDIPEQECRAAGLLLECVRKKSKPASILVRVPIVSNGDVATSSSEPTKSLMKLAGEAEKMPGIWAVSLFNGQPWADVAGAGASVVVSCTDSEEGLKCARTLALRMWQVRGEYAFPAPLLPTQEALKKGLHASGKPAFITDTGDNVTGGAAGDNAQMLRLLLRTSSKNALLAGITDAPAVEICRNLPFGATVTLRLGASLDGSSQSVDVCAQVKARGSVPLWRNDGCCDAVLLGVSGVDVIVTQKRCALTAPGIFERLGIRLDEYQIVVVKLGYLFPELLQVAGAVYMALTDGATCEDIRRCGFAKIPRPMYPFDEDFSFTPQSLPIA